MRRMMVCICFSVFAGIFLTNCQALPHKTLTTEEWAERRHPPSDTGLLPEGCKPVKYRGGYYPIAEAFKGSCSHCVVHDFLQKNARDWIEGGLERGSPTDGQGDGSILTFYKSSVSDLNIRNHLVSGRPFNNTNGVGMLGEDMAYLKVHNGKIETPGLLERVMHFRASR